MTATILTFPGVDRTAIRPRPTSLADLPEGAKSLVVIAEGGRFAVVIRPAVTAAERRARRSFAKAEEARDFARRMAIAYPQLYRLILDEVPPRRQTLDEIMGFTPYDPSGPKDAA